MSRSLMQINKRSLGVPASGSPCWTPGGGVEGVRGPHERSSEPTVMVYVTC